MAMASDEGSFTIDTYYSKPTIIAYLPSFDWSVVYVGHVTSYLRRLRDVSSAIHAIRPSHGFAILRIAREPRPENYMNRCVT